MTTGYDASPTTITLSSASLADGVIRAGAAVDNDSNGDDDAQVVGTLKLNSTGVDANGEIKIYVYSGDGTFFTDAAVGTDVVHTDGGNLILLDVLVANVNSKVLEFSYKIAALFGGALPRNWGIMIGNESGATLDSTAGNHAYKFYGILRT